MKPKVKKEKPTLTESEALGFSSLMVIVAFRYCCGRQTYIVGACADWLVENWAKFPQNVRDVIQRDLEAYNSGRASGDPLSCYPPEGGEGEWRFVDPDTGEEVFPEVSYQDLREIENFIFEEMEGDNR